MKQLMLLPLVVFVFTCAASTVASERELVSIKAAVMSADYRGDLAQLAALRKRAAKWSDDPKWGYLADYWSGFASWRTAMNGANVKMPLADIKQHLEIATADFESSLRKKSDFADAYAGAAGTLGWLAAFEARNPDEMNRIIKRSHGYWTRALELDPTNPRALWIQAAVYLYSPPERGGSRDRAVEIYQQMLEVSGPPVPDSPLPDWGKAEALMSLAWTHFNAPAPDVKAATEKARAALRLQPEWHYVKNILLPQIEGKGAR